MLVLVPVVHRYRYILTCTMQTALVTRHDGTSQRHVTTMHRDGKRRHCQCDATIATRQWAYEKTANQKHTERAQTMKVSTRSGKKTAKWRETTTHRRRHVLRHQCALPLLQEQQQAAPAHHIGHGGQSGHVGRWDRHGRQEVPVHDGRPPWDRRPVRWCWLSRDLCDLFFVFSFCCELVQVCVYIPVCSSKTRLRR